MTAKLNRLALAITVMLAGSAAGAATGSGTLIATATVLASCSIGSAALGFGAYDPGSATNTDAATTVLVLCTNGSAYSIYSTTALAGRTMVTGIGGAGRELTFGVYGSPTDRSAGTQLPLTNTTGKIAGTGSGLPQNVDLYGRVAALQNVFTGNYTNAAAPTNLTIEY